MALTIDDAQRQIDCGIWQGRFQFVHNGHEAVFKSALKGFKEKFIAIVNPNPQVPVDEFVRFDTNLNPFNYFKRMLLWKVIADEQEQDVTIVPCWHARKSVYLENEFLPRHSVNDPGRCWIVPIGQDDNERRKEADLTNLGEIVCDSNYGEEPINCRGIAASLVRQYFEQNQWDNFNQCVPECIQELTRQLVKNQDPFSYKIVPILDDTIDYTSLQFAIDWARQDKNRFIVIAISVGIETGVQWWYEPALRLNSHHTFYSKSKAIKNIFKKLNILNYLITPFFVQDNDMGRVYTYSEAFLPSKKNSTWLLNNNLQYSYGLKPCLRIQKTEDVSGIFVDQANLQIFYESDIEQISRNKTIIEEEISKLKNEIEYFINIHTSSSVDNDLVEQFIEKPDMLQNLLIKIQYNVISVGEATEIYKKIKQEWSEK